MKKTMKKILKSSLMGSLFLMALGILLIFQSEATIVTISYIIGAVLIASGVMAILTFFKQESNNITGMNMVYGVACIVLGILVITNPHAIASVIPVVMGIIIIVNSGTKLQYSLDLKKNKNELWKSTMILAIITTICGIVLIFNPFKGAVFITKIIGTLILLYSVLDIISTITIKNTVNAIHQELEEKVKEAEIVEEKDETKMIKDKEKEENEND